MLLGGLVVAALAVPIGIASLRVRGASFVIVSIAMVLILLLVFQSWGEFTGGSNGLRVPRPFGPEVLRPEQHERFFYLHAALLAVALLVLVADRPLALRHRPQGDPRGRGQGPVARRPDLHLQARRLRHLGVLHRPRRRPVRPVVRLPRPDLPVLDPGRLLHGADEPARRHPQPLRPAARRGDRRLRRRVLQEPVRRHPVPPGRDGRCSSPSWCSSCPTGSSRRPPPSSTASGRSGRLHPRGQRRPSSPSSDVRRRATPTPDDPAGTPEPGTPTTSTASPKEPAMTATAAGARPAPPRGIASLATVGPDQEVRRRHRHRRRERDRSTTARSTR